MRWLFLFLLALNIGYVAWELRFQRPEPDKTHRIPDGVERIVLLSELSAGETVEPEPVTTPIESAQDEVASPPDAAEAAAQSPEEVAEKAADKPPALVEVTVAENKLATTPAPAPEKPRPKPSGDQCFTVGPFSDMAPLRVVTREIKDYVVEASFRSAEQQEQSKFRVYLKPTATKQEARAITKLLASKNIKDYFIINSGPNKNAISLGYFSGKSRAYKHAARIKKLGFDAVAEPVFRTYTIYWLDYRIKAGKEIPQHIFDDLLEDSARRLSRSCN